MEEELVVLVLLLALPLMEYFGEIFVSSVLRFLSLLTRELSECSVKKEEEGERERESGVFM